MLARAVRVQAPPPSPEPRPAIRGLVLIGAAPRGVENGARLSELAREFPGLSCRWVTRTPRQPALVREAEWCATAHDPRRTDERLLGLEARPGWLSLEVAPGSKTIARTAVEVLTRYQRLLLRCNEASSDDVFRAALTAHRRLHDLERPLVKADYDHALDAWQWTLRLNPLAGRALQLAALFHDVERLWSEAERRVEQHASDYQAFKDAHARSGAERAVEVLALAGVPSEERLEVARLISEHERPFDGGGNGSWQALADADALSFFALNSPGFADYYGPEHTRRKVRYSLGRMTPAGLARLATIRLRADVAALVREALPAERARRLEEPA